MREYKDIQNHFGIKLEELHEDCDMTWDGVISMIKNYSDGVQNDLNIVIDYKSKEIESLEKRYEEMKELAERLEKRLYH